MSQSLEAIKALALKWEGQAAEHNESAERLKASAPNRAAALRGSAAACTLHASELRALSAQKEISK